MKDTSLAVVTSGIHFPSAEGDNPGRAENPATDV